MFQVLLFNTLLEQKYEIKAQELHQPKRDIICAQRKKH